MAQLILTGDVNLMNVNDPTVPFRKVIDEFKAADVRFSNMECCLYAPPTGQVWDNEGFMAAPGPAGESLKYAGIDAVGIANNVNYGEAAINASVARLDEIGVKHTLFNRTVLFNVTGFYQKFSDFQLNTFLGTAFVVESIPELTSRGGKGIRTIQRAGFAKVLNPPIELVDWGAIEGKNT